MRALILLIFFCGMTFGQNIINIIVYEETTGNLPGPFTGLNIPIGVWHLLQYTGGWGSNSPPPPPPPNGCTAGGNSSMVWDEILMFETMGSPNFVSMPLRGRWGNYFVGAALASRAPGEHWSNPKLEAQSNEGNWEFFSFLTTQATAESVALIGDYSSHRQIHTGTLTLRAELRLQCASQSPYIVSQTFCLAMMDPETSFYRSYLGDLPTRHLRSFVLGHKDTEPAMQWPMPYDYSEENYIGGNPQPSITMEEIMLHAPPVLGLDFETVYPAGYMINLAPGIYDIYMHVYQMFHVFTFYPISWLGVVDENYYLTCVFVLHAFQVDGAPF